MAKIPIILEAGRADGKLVTSDAIFDENKEMFQSEINDIQDTLNSNNPNKPLSAKQGKILKELLNSKVIEVGSIPIDTEPIEGNITHLVNSDGLAKEFNKCNLELILRGVYDVSAHNKNVMFESLQSLLSSSNLSTLIPTSVRHGGMTIRFIQGSEQSSDNKYVQYRLMADTFSTIENDWQGVDETPTAGSNNLVKSAGVADVTYAIEGSLYNDLKGFVMGYYALLGDTIDVDAAPIGNQYIWCRKLKVKAGQKYCYKGGRCSSTYTWSWATADNSGTILARADSREVKTYYISVTQDGYLFVNCDAGYFASLVFYRISEIDNISDRITGVTNTIIEVKYGDNCLYPYLESHYNTLLDKYGGIYTNNGWYTSQPIYWGGHTEIKISRYRYLAQYDVEGKLVEILYPSEVVVNAIVSKASGAYYLLYNIEMNKRESTIATFDSNFPSSYVAFSQSIVSVNGVPIKDNGNEMFQDWVLSESYKISSTLSYDNDGNIVTPVSVVYPDGGKGSITITRDDDGNMTELTATHTGMNKTLTAVFTRNSDGNVTNENITIN